MDELTKSLITVLGTGLITSSLTYFSTRSKARLDAAAEYDKKVREERIETYKKLWSKLKPLARYSSESPITYQVVKSLSEEMRDWYFDVGGIYLTPASRRPYFELKEMMQRVIDEKASDGQIDENLIAPLLKQGSALRTSLSNDIGTRKGSAII